MNNMTQQTAVEWLEQELKKLPFVNVIDVFDQAKQMEKEQIVNAHIYSSGNSSIVEAEYLAEQYYEGTYGKPA